jgi:hypothetical protein
MAQANCLYNQTYDRIEDRRLALARELVPFARLLRDRAKAQANLLGTIDRCFGSDQTRHLARLLDDVWLSLDVFVADFEQEV